MKTAKALRITVPPSQLARRDEVIEEPQFRRRTLLHLLTAVSGTEQEYFGVAAFRQSLGDQETCHRPVRRSCF